MYRTLFFVIVFLLTASPVSADETKKLTSAELKDITSKMFFSAGYSTGWNISYHVTWLPNGTREVYWTRGVGPSHVVKSVWRLEGDTVCVKNEDWVLERCGEWRKNGDRIETWGKLAQNGYFYILR